MQRRTFLSSALLLPQAAKAAGAGDWAGIRGQFAFTEKRVPMNAANLCPSPRTVTDRVIELTRDMDADCSFQNRVKFAETLEASRAAVAAQLGIDPDELALVRNTSEANNVVNNGLALRAGDEVVIWDQNHPTNNVAWDVRAARFGIAVKRVATPASPSRVQQLIDPFERAIGPRTRVLSITHVSNGSGVRLPARELGEIARQRGLHFHVDGAQSWGAFAVNPRDLGCDSYSASAHKWYMGPREVGILYVRAARQTDIWPNVVAPGWGNDVQPDVKGARKFESLGQRDDARLAALRTAAEFHAAIGPRLVEKRVFELASALKERIAATGIPLKTPMSADLSGGVIVVPTKDGAAAAKVFEELYAKYGIAGAANNGLRLCPHVYNTIEHIERAAAGIRAMRALFA